MSAVSIARLATATRLRPRCPNVLLGSTSSFTALASISSSSLLQPRRSFVSHPPCRPSVGSLPVPPIPPRRSPSVVLLPRRFNSSTPASEPEKEDKNDDELYVTLDNLPPPRRNRDEPIIIPLLPSKPVRDIAPYDAPKSRTLAWVIYGWQYMKFLFGGLNEVIVAWNITARRNRAIYRDGRPLNWEEANARRRAKTDLWKLLPAGIVVLSTFEELIPLLIIFFPSIIPSTILLPSQARQLAHKRERTLFLAREAILKEMQQPPTPGIQGPPGGHIPEGLRRGLVGWNGKGWVQWESQDITLLTPLFTGHKLTKGRRPVIEGTFRQACRVLDDDDKLLLAYPVERGLTKDQLHEALQRRGLLSLALPDEELGPRLAAYIHACRWQANFHPLPYVLNDIMENQARFAKIDGEEQEVVRENNEEEARRNGGYTGWKAWVRRLFIKETETEQGAAKAGKGKPEDVMVVPGEECHDSPSTKAPLPPVAEVVEKVLEDVAWNDRTVTPSPSSAKGGETAPRSTSSSVIMEEEQSARQQTGKRKATAAQGRRVI